MISDRITDPPLGIIEGVNYVTSWSGQDLDAGTASYLAIFGSEPSSHKPKNHNEKKLANWLEIITNIEEGRVALNSL